MVIFHSYVKPPEGNHHSQASGEQALVVIQFTLEWVAKALPSHLLSIVH
jgi:hypothetical protein